MECPILRNVISDLTFSFQFIAMLLVLFHWCICTFYSSMKGWMFYAEYFRV